VIVGDWHVYRLSFGGYEDFGEYTLLHGRCFEQAEFQAMCQDALLASAEAHRAHHETQRGRKYWKPWEPRWRDLIGGAVSWLCSEHGFTHLDRGAEQASYGLWGESDLLSDPADPAASWNSGHDADILHAQSLVRRAFPEDAERWDAEERPRWKQ
jgi:hypothetical protein